jgi:xylan 1,4-beta-xylosidase
MLWTELTRRSSAAVRRSFAGALLVCAASACIGASPSAEKPAAIGPGSARDGAAPSPEEAQKMYDNPILSGFYPDPSICRVGEDYYLVTSSFEYFPGVPVFHSKDLVHWRQIGHALTRQSQLELAGAKSSQGIFAPTIRHHDGTFYMVTTNVSSNQSFYVETRDPGGEWSDPRPLPEAAFTMDPSLLFDDDGRVYYTRHSGGEHGEIIQTELDVRTGKLLGETRTIWTGTGGVWPEGPHLYRLFDRYYLMISEGGTSTGHSLTVARSASPFGPFEAYAKNPILAHRDRPNEPIQATGHGDLVQAPDGRFWIVFLGIRRWDGKHHHLGRETFLAPVSWNEDHWPVINGGAPIRLQMSATGLPVSIPWPETNLRDDFESPELALAWNFVRAPAPGLSLAERPGFLRLYGTAASLDDVATPAFVGQRQRHFRSRASTALEFAPATEGHRAGLTVRANEQNHYDLSVTRVDGRLRAELRTRLSGAASLVGQAPISVGPVTLAVESFPDHYAFSAIDSARVRYELGQAPTAPLSSESAGGFTGVYFGLFATGGSGSEAREKTPPADFDWFEYRALSD